MLVPVLLFAQSMQGGDPTRDGLDRSEPIRVTDSIYQAVGFSNTFLVKTPAGSLVIDTAMPAHAQRHRKMLGALQPGPIRTIILTHGHGDHTGGVPLWREPDTQVVAQRNFVEFRHYQARLAGFFARRNAAQFGLNIPAPAPVTSNYPARIEATILFDQKHTFTLGGVGFEVHATPGETPDHATVWIPAWKAAFVGDNWYASFPNIYTLRGTEPRWALDYVNSLNKVLAWKPELLLPSHGQPIHGWPNIERALTTYRDAILYVHDATVKGMNEGAGVFTLMREIKLPTELDVGEGYGTIAWSVRGIYEGYAGWFDGNAAAMYSTAASAIHPELVRMAGGAQQVAARARKLLEEGRTIEALQLTDAALAADPRSRAAWEVRIAALERLLKESRNSNERGWLNHALGEAKKAMGEQK